LRRQRAKSIVEGDEIRVACCHGERVVDRDIHGAAATLLIFASPRRVDQDSAHLPRGKREEVRPIVPIHLVQIHEPEVDLVNKCCRAQCVIRSLGPKIVAGAAM
jgi:hypothetical protein